jgi:integrase/recombinase XerD
VSGTRIPGANAVLVLTGKGNKTRRVPLMKNTASLLVASISENRLDGAHKKTYPLFTNSQHNRLTKEGVAYVLGKYAAQAHELSDVVPAKVNCHLLRHSKAVHLLQAGVNLIYIRDFLGHTDMKTTEVYARADTELKRKALEQAYPDLVDPDLPDWNTNTDLMSWLASL